MGLLDRAIEAVSPEWGLRRARARAATAVLNAGFSHHGANRTRREMAEWRTESGSPDSDIVDNLPTLRERSRDLCMGEGLAIGGLKTIRVNEVGAGLQLNAAVNAKILGLSVEAKKAWEDQVETEFALWAGTKMCDAAKRCNFGQLQALARLSQLQNGDVFALLPNLDDGERYGLRVHLIEADRVSNPEDRVITDADVNGGVEVGKYGEPIAYYVLDQHPGDLYARHLRSVRRRTWTRVPAFGPETGRPLVLHLMEVERPGQRRGIPLLAPVIEKVKQLSRYSHAEVTAAVVSALFTAAITTPTPTNQLGPANADPVEQEGEEDAAEYKLGPGALIGLAPGEKLEAINPARPNANFEPFVMAICRQIGAALGVPYELLIMQFTASYSASRGALLEAWKRFHVGRQWLVMDFCQPVYETWLAEAVARGYIDAPGFFADPLIRAAWCGAEWHGPTQGQLDPTKEVDAAAKRIAEGLSTRTQETRELTGGDFWSNNETRAAEEQARRDVGLVAGAGGATLTLTPSDVAAVTKVDEARASVGLPPEGGEVGSRYVTEHAAKVGADAAPDIEKAAAEKGGESDPPPAPEPEPDDGEEDTEEEAA